MRGLLAVVADVGLVLVFVIIGRHAHHVSGGFAGLVSTAWPFLTGLAIGELAARSWRRPAAITPTGVIVWLSTVAGGMTLRVLAGQGTALAFIAVALAFLGLFLLGWRFAVRVLPVIAGRVIAGR
ncbi:MAG TPA: DUF3054 domain-containing protein [Streptosporangiaceae bacterium]|nr:DUF3054 domain-containing protein [Streptosporangiaceae bacterium]